MLRIAILGLAIVCGTAAARAGAAEDCEHKTGVEAIQACSQVIREGGDIAWAHYNRGVEHANQGDYDAAITDYTTAIRLRPTYHEAFNNRGIAYEVKKELDRAIADYARAIDLNPNFAFAFNNRANVFKAKGDFERAFADYARAIAIDPGYAQAYSNRADAHVKKGEYERAITDADAALALQPELADAFATRAAAHVGKGDHDRAIDDYTRAIEIDADTAGFVADRGFARYYKGDFRGAAEDLKRAFELESGPYVMLFRFLAQARIGESGREELIANAQELADPAAWPQPVIEMFMGRRTPEATLAAAGSNEEKCEANFYVGQWYLLADAHALAVQHLQVAARTCPRGFIERRAANAELKAMNRQ